MKKTLEFSLIAVAVDGFISLPLKVWFSHLGRESSRQEEG
jgi:hypothetical protein